MSSTTSPTPSSVKSKLFKAPDSDLILLSSDQHKFPVERVVLMGTSRVFRDILTLPRQESKPQVRVTEHSSILDPFLRFLHRGSDPRDLSFETLKALWKLSDKYDAPIICPALAVAAFGHLRENAMDVWALMTILQQEGMATECLKYMDQIPPHLVAPDRVGPTGVPSSGHRAGYSPSDMTPDLLELVPAKRLRQLLKAYDRVARGLCDWKSVNLDSL